LRSGLPASCWAALAGCFTDDVVGSDLRAGDGLYLPRAESGAAWRGGMTAGWGILPGAMYRSGGWYFPDTEARQKKVALEKEREKRSKEKDQEASA
jgi:hypothetical protein